MGTQDDVAFTCAAYRVTENGQTWYFTTSPGEELLDAAQMLRRYCTSTGHSTGKFISLYSQAQPSLSTRNRSRKDWNRDIPLSRPVLSRG